jgi:predicted acylesterase/phospholipase RssA
MPRFEKRIVHHRGITVIQKRDPEVMSLRPGKVAIVLAGGAISGGGYKAGGLKALDEIFTWRRREGGKGTPFRLTDFDIFVGLSAGSMLASVLAAGIPPEEMLRILVGASATYEPFRARDFMRPNLPELLERTFSTLLHEQELLTKYLSGGTSPRTGDRFTLRGTARKMALDLGRAIPTGLFDPSGLESYLRRNMERAGLPNDFATARQRTGKGLYLTASDLNLGELVCFGHDEPYSGVPISEAVAASCALPGWYRPMRVVNPRAKEPGEPEFLDLCDGGVMRTANVRVAVEKGAELIICYNPFARIRYERAGRSLVDHGAFAVANQVARLLIGARLDLAKDLLFRDDTVEADVVFIEPAEDDYDLFAMNPMNFWAKDIAASHGYRQVRGALIANYELLAEIFRVHGIEIRRIDGTSPEAKSHGAPTRLSLRETRGSSSPE